MPEGPSREDGGRCDSASDNTTRHATINREGEQMALPGQIRVHKIKAWLRPYPVIYSMVAKAYHNSGFDRIESAASAQPLIDRLRGNFYRKYTGRHLRAMVARACVKRRTPPQNDTNRQKGIFNKSLTRFCFYDSLAEHGRMIRIQFDRCRRNP